MRQYLIAKLRERNLSCRRLQTNVAVQLDYYMSPQFAGMAAALVSGSYDGLNVSFLPTCPVGLEQDRVHRYQLANPAATCIGSVEQNIFIPNLHSNPSLRVKAVAAMFRRSPLCIASVGESFSSILAHEDTVPLLRRIFPNYPVSASSRGTKVTEALKTSEEGTSLHAIQAYLTTEVPTLRRHLGCDPHVIMLEGLNGTKLGYGQVLFASEQSLECEERREIISKFLKATFNGWNTVIRNPQDGVKMVQEAKRILKLDDEANDHWYPSDEFQLEMLQLCNDFVKETFEGDRLGIIDTNRWNEATEWLLGGDQVTVEPNFGLEPNLWQVPENLLSGNELARTMMQDAKNSAVEFRKMHGRKPSVAVISVGELRRYKHADRRLQLYSNSMNSWFDKTSTGQFHEFEVQEINLDVNATTEDVLSAIYALGDVDGIQVMWPLPEHIHSPSVYNAIPLDQDVDGIHFVGQREIGHKEALPPVTAAGALALLKKYDINVANKKVLVIGRSPIVGSPIANMLRAEDAIVTVAHSKVSPDKLETLVRESDIIFSCAGYPGLIQAEWTKQSIVINVGSTFIDTLDMLQSDVAGDLSAHALRFSPVPGGVGPLSAPMLFTNVIKAAWANIKGKGSVLNSWQCRPSAIFKKYHFNSYEESIAFLQKVEQMSGMMDHHANAKVTHRCIHGVDVELEFFSYEAKKLTDKDFDAAKAIDSLTANQAIDMNDFKYDLKQESIATHPAFPRGSSKLLHVNEDGHLAFYDHFETKFPSLAAGSHLVFNDSRVLDARLFVRRPSGGKFEMMILDLGGIDVKSKCKDVELHVMLRTEILSVGDILELVGGCTAVVKGIKCAWHEEDLSDGNGTECFVTILSDITVEKALNNLGTVPIPPYFHREAEESDKDSYNTVYAAANGNSVAAPTAGLHFTQTVMEKIGMENISFLSLHIGAGTFKPVSTVDARNHTMHRESFSVSVHELRRIIKALEVDQKPIVSIGTTSCRTLETLHWCGIKKLKGKLTDLNNLSLDQFEWIPLSVGDSKFISPVSSFKALVEGLDDTETLSGTTGLMIIPGRYEFQVIDHLVTNFHAPDSTLMLLASAFLGSSEKVKSVYESAEKKGYRFLSYGDVCFFTLPKSTWKQV